MSELKKYKYPLLVILVLCIFKFIVVPSFTWQDTLIAENKLLQRKVQKVGYLLADEEQLTTKLAAQEKQLNEVAQYFYNYQEEQAFRLAQQKTIEQQLSKFELKSSSIGWQNVVEIPDTPLIRFQLQYSFSGDGEQIIGYLLAQQSLKKWHDIESLNVSVRRQKAGRIGQMTVTTRVSFYMLNKEHSNG
ncbi:hypothetical protein [Pseudoalteromonas distincta]|uniref:hypothetical protein n=1 Tax=Pseudoalteromonas distincta TaxID=77608 RepID=UPI0032E300B3